MARKEMESADSGDQVDAAYQHWFYDGFSVRDAAAEAGIGASTLQDRIKKMRSKNPDLDELRGFTKEMKATGKTFPDLKRYGSWKDTIDERHIDTSDLEKCLP